MIELKYFREIDGEYYFDHGDKYETWYISVKKSGIEIERGSEDHGGTFYHPDLAGVLCEAVDLYRYLRNIPGE